MGSEISIFFHQEDTPFELQPEKTRLVQEWLLAVIQLEGFVLNNLNYIFCSDDYLLQMNQQYLDHDTYTDVITFDNSEIDSEIEGDIFISIDRVKENAAAFQKDTDNELCRVMVHGLLHLCGYSDKTSTDMNMMRQKEDEHLDVLQDSKS